jgi:hypothetical protein
MCVYFLIYHKVQITHACSTSIPCCGLRACFGCFEGTLVTVNSEEISPFDIVDRDMEMAKRLVCLQCRTTERRQMIPGVIAPARDARLVAPILRRENLEIADIPTGLSPDVRLQVDRAMTLIGAVIDDWMIVQKDEMAEAAARSQAIAAAVASAEAAMEGAARRQEAGTRRAGLTEDRIDYNTGYLMCGGEVIRDEVDEEMAMQWDNKDKDPDYVGE